MVINIQYPDQNNVVCLKTSDRTEAKNAQQTPKLDNPRTKSDPVRARGNFNMKQSE